MSLEEWREILACPECHGRLSSDLTCELCAVSYELGAGVAKLVPPRIARSLEDGAEGWDRWHEAIRGLKAWRSRRSAAPGTKNSSVDSRIVSLLRDASPSGFVVDIGGADGAKLHALPAEVTRYLSVDPCCTASPARAGCHALSVRAVAEALPLASGVADVVFSVAAMDYFVDPVCALREFSRVLRPGGTLALLVTVHPGPVALARGRNSRTHRVLSSLSPSVLRSVGPRAALSLGFESALSPWREHTRYLTEDRVLSWLAEGFEARSIARDPGLYSTVLRYVGNPKGLSGA